ncbi:MAG: RDD family protein [Chloroflexaceae bacterium]|nr:RDD family protein [Chloroflexaceae bacterium]NJO04143.1 RDD family protein [Chloroflexaceae bacterium]
MPTPRQRMIHRGMLGHYAGVFSRLVALIIDVVLFLLTLSLITLVMNNFADFIRLTTGFNIAQFVSDQMPDIAIPAWLANLSGFLLSSAFLYALLEVFFLSTAGRTPGKTFMGIRVVNSEGRHPSLFQSIVRQLGKYPSALLLLSGFWWVLFDGRRQGLHDKLARTFVIYTWDARPDETFLVEQIRSLPEPPQKQR